MNPVPDEPESPPPTEEPTPDVSARTDRWAHRRGEPRTFAAAWIVFLFTAAIVALGAGGSLGLVATDAYRTSARVLMVLAGVGVGVLWPLLRLSQEAPRHPARAALRDLVLVLAPLQAIIWPQALPWMAAWPLEVVAALAGLFTAWALVVSGVLAMTLRGPVMPGVRAAVMIGLILAGMLTPGLRLLLGLPDELARRSRSPDVLLTATPITGGWEIPTDRSWSGAAGDVSRAQWFAIAAVGVVGVGIWGIAAGVVRRREPA
ncbi:MAG: hypothetical protein HBSAPP03_29510 [Phycisphaerae bacterium]|nr:MAG: hypothetical protein HBSAPP03_29510 [Phycisphaerae bacterium]